MKALIIDDLHEARVLLHTILRPYGDCDAVDNGRDAIEMFRMAFEEEPYDLVLLDLTMPGMDGIEVLQTMRSLERELGVEPDEQTIIIIVSAVDARSEMETCFSSGANDYINKPVSSAKLLLKLSQYNLVAKKWWEQKEDPPV
ncbi:MAG: response regulator [Magnetococcales bacterium]|nr:response regulator [Magnetococcales bacterium]MBF0420589.1 response regulator [Magnetococcales bacterium]